MRKGSLRCARVETAGEVGLYMENEELMSAWSSRGSWLLLRVCEVIFWLSVAYLPRVSASERF